MGWAVGYTAMGILTYPKYYCWNTARRSPNFVYNQIKVNANCGSGSYPKDALNLVKGQGDCSWFLMPYINGDCATQPNAGQNNDAGQNKAYQWVALNANDVAGIKQALDLGFPVINAFDVTASFDNMWGTNGIWNTNVGNIRGGHATCIIGYDDTKQMFKVQNQWGVAGGDNGYYWVTYNLVQNNCMRELYIVYGISNSNAPSINGTSPICTSNNYSINNLPPNVSVSWSSSPSSGVVTFSCTNCSQTVVSKATGGTTTIQASLTDNCSSAITNLYTTVLAGIGDPVFEQKTIICSGNNQYSLSAIVTALMSATQYSWYIDGVLKTTSGTSNSATVFGGTLDGRTHTLQAKIQMACGLSATALPEGRYTATCGGGNLVTISPNPSGNTLTIETAGEDKFTNIRIVDKLGNLKKQFKILATNKTTINISELPFDTYNVQVFNGTNWTSVKFIKN